jgi:hypothetical protein
MAQARSNTRLNTRAKAKPGTAPAAGKRSGDKGAGAVKKRVMVTPEQRRQMVAEAAYFRAERRQFRPGDSVQDWVEAETEIDELLSR